MSAPPLIQWRMGQIADGRTLTILNFHKVSDDPLDRHEAIPPAVFDRLIGWLNEKFRIVSFAELGSLDARGKPPLIVSFDDGYRDFIDVAAPISRKHGAPFNINIIPGCVDSGRPPFNIILKDFIFQAPDKLLRETPLPGLPRGADPQRRDSSSLISSAAFKNQPIADQKAAWPDLWEKIARYDGLKITALMNRDHVRQLAGEFEFGAHSFEHATMNLESESYLRADLRKCADWWRDLTGHAFEVYAFPNGGATMQQAQVALEEGYAHVLLVGENFSSPGARVHSRITMFGRELPEATVRALGGPRFWKSGVAPGVA